MLVDHLARSILQLEPRRVLIIKPSALGDVVHTLPVLHLLRKRWPKSHIAWLVMPAFADILRDNPDLDQVILFDRKRYADAGRGLLAWTDFLDFAQSLERQLFDVVIDLQGLFRSAMMTFATQAVTRVGFSYAREGAWLAYTHRVKQPARNSDTNRANPEATHRHAIERYLDVTQALGAGRSPVVFDFATTQEHANQTRDLTRDAGERYAVVLPGTNWPTKRWPADSFADVADRLKRSLDLKIVLAGGPDVAGLASVIRPDVDLAGKTSLKQLVCLLKDASVVIANDSGPMHIASALGRPLVTMFGPTDPARTGPFQRPETVVRLDVVCSPCLKRSCSHQCA